MRAPVTTSLPHYRFSHATSIAICGKPSRLRVLGRDDGAPARFLGFVRVILNHLLALAQRHQYRIPPAEWRERRRLLVDLLVGPRIEPHVQVIAADVLENRGDEFNVSRGLPLLHREQMQLREFFRRVALGVLPIRHACDCSSYSDRGAPSPPREIIGGHLWYR